MRFMDRKHVTRIAFPLEVVRSTSNLASAAVYKNATENIVEEKKKKRIKSWTRAFSPYPKIIAYHRQNS